MLENYELNESLQKQLNALFVTHEESASKIQEEFEKVESSHDNLLNDYFDGKMEAFGNFKSILETLGTNREELIKKSGECLEMELELNNNTKYLNESFFCMDWTKQ